MYKDTNLDDIQSAIEILIESGHAIMEQNNYGDRGYHITAHCFSSGKNECFKPANSTLYRWGTRSGKFDWYKFAIIPARQKKSYRNEMYEAINGQKKSL